PAQPPSAEASPPAPAAPIRMNPASIPMNPIPMKPTPGPMSNKGPALTPRVQPARPLNGNSFNGHHAPAAPAPTAAAPNGTPPPAAPAQPALTPAPAPAAPAKPAAESLLVALSALAANWPDEIRKEILLLKLVDAKVGLPVDAIEQALKQGRIVFSWKTLRSWMQPSQTQTVSNQDSTVLELPLQLVAPLFLERQRQNSKTQQKISVDEDIPNLFFGFPQPDAPVGAGAGAEDTNFYVWDDRSDTAMVDRSAEKRPTPGTKFVAKYATPNEVVSRAAALEGVAGSIIALPDGLMVASRLAPDMNGDTLAAFLPHIFGKVSQCTKELRMGELNNLNFTVGNVPWKIFRVNAIFFAAFGTAGKALPTAQLAALAGDLNHKPK
ncbi:MAG TPA: roadblock/LC7 domain-containing protein, partial [Clostridia bacterium]|nr:roadblock/LC7 domain-containing protein [Clostridia bacterium]